MNGAAGPPNPLMRRGNIATSGAREQSGETSLVKSKETCVRDKKKKLLDTGTQLERTGIGL